jgi:DNA helicase II / ATP-dependent DNA helicase PcrA
MALVAKSNSSYPSGRQSTITGTAVRPSWTPSDQQARICRFLEDDPRHLMVEALAGSGKTSTIVMAAWALHDRRLRSVVSCFNKHIAGELQGKLPSGSTARTLHSLGFALLRSRLGEIHVDDDKVDRIAERFFPAREQRPERYAVAQLVSLCKNLLLDGGDVRDLKQLAADFDVELPVGSAGDVLAVVPDVLDACRDQTQTIDYDDMVWLPVVLGMTAPHVPDVLFVDEAQDLSPSQHALVDLLSPSGRVVGVGDRWQSVYAWRGADAASMDRLEGKLGRTPRGVDSLPLTVTRRCPRRHVELARSLVPHLDHLPSAIDGEVEEIPRGRAVEDAQVGDMVLCRTNAPLVSLAYQLIRRGTPAFVRGRDIGRGLLVLIARLRCREVGDLMRRIGDFRAAESAKYAELRNPGPPTQTLNDKCDCLLALCEGASTVEEVKRRAETLFADVNEDTAVILSSIHRAKGLERERILIVSPELLPGPWARTPEAEQQERNVTYVAITRSKRRLAFAGVIPEVLQP